MFTNRHARSAQIENVLVLGKVVSEIVTRVRRPAAFSRVRERVYPDLSCGRRNEVGQCICQLEPDWNSSSKLETSV